MWCIAGFFVHVRERVCVGEDSQRQVVMTDASRGLPQRLNKD